MQIFSNQIFPYKRCHYLCQFYPVLTKIWLWKREPLFMHIFSNQIFLYKRESIFVLICLSDPLFMNILSLRISNIKASMLLLNKFDMISIDPTSFFSECYMSMYCFMYFHIIHLSNCTLHKFFRKLQANACKVR